ncbi:MAG: hypothetical protein OER56_02970 [Hyphomicrobiales bacterium]|nr:hypothetical protein [Hyphomicrobiales bacterium]
MIHLRPAKHSDIANLGQYLPALQFKALAIQLVRGPAWAVIDGDLLALGGLVPLEQGTAEFWMRSAQGIAGSRRGLPVIRLIRQHMRTLPRELTIVAHVQPGHRAGQVIARYMGLRLIGPVFDGRLERYETCP